MSGAGPDGVDEGAGDRDEDAPTPGPARTPRTGRPPTPPPLPWYRKGSVWFGFVVASVIGALVIADLAEDRIYSYDIDPASPEAAAWCEAAAPIDAGLGFWGGVLADEQVHARRLDALRAAREVAPSEIADDLDEVIGAEVERQERAAELLRRREAGGTASSDSVDDVREDHHVAFGRVEGFHYRACPIG